MHNKDNLLLRLGEYDFESTDEPLGHVNRRVLRVVRHPKYDANSYNGYDMALLRFDEPVRFAKNMIPICLPDENEDWAGQTGWTTGWGRLYDGKELICISTKIIKDSPLTFHCFGQYSQVPNKLVYSLNYSMFSS